MRTDAADWALAAQALVEASVEGNAANWKNILDTTETSELVIGLVVLAASLRASLAAANGVDKEEIDDVMRAMFFFNAPDLAFGDGAS